MFIHIRNLYSTIIPLDCFLCIIIIITFYTVKGVQSFIHILYIIFFEDIRSVFTQEMYYNIQYIYTLRGKLLLFFSSHFENCE